jgi:hypothetical protein
MGAKDVSRRRMARFTFSGRTFSGPTLRVTAKGSLLEGRPATRFKLRVRNFWGLQNPENRVEAAPFGGRTRNSQPGFLGPKSLVSDPAGRM